MLGPRSAACLDLRLTRASLSEGCLPLFILMGARVNELFSQTLLVSR